MVAPQDTRKVVKMLRELGWEPVRHQGSHTVWLSPKGSRLTIADGHGQISAGVYRQVLKSIAKDEAK